MQQPVCRYLLWFLQENYITDLQLKWKPPKALRPM